MSDIRTDSEMLRPAPRAAIPKAIDAGRYPRTTGIDARSPSGKLRRASSPAFSSYTSGHQLERDPGSPSPDQRAQRQLQVSVPPQRPPRPPDRREHGREERSPLPEDVEQADQRSGDPGRMERYLGERGEEREGRRREGVGEQNGAQRRGTAEEGDDPPGPGVQARHHPEGPHPLLLRNLARVPHLSRTCQVRQVDERKPTGKQETEQGPEKPPPPCGRRANQQEQRHGQKRQAGKNRGGAGRPREDQPPGL